MDNLSNSRLQRFLERKRGDRPVRPVDRMVFLPFEDFERRHSERSPDLSFTRLGSESPSFTPVREEKRKLRESFLDKENSMALSEEHVKKMARIQRGPRAPVPYAEKLVIKPSRQSSPSVTGSTSPRRRALGDKTMANRAESVLSHRSNDSFKSLKSIQQETVKQTPQRQSPVRSFFQQESTQKVQFSQQSEEEEVLTSFSVDNEPEQPTNKDTLPASNIIKDKDQLAPPRSIAATATVMSEAPATKVLNVDDRPAKITSMQQPSDSPVADNLDEVVENTSVQNSIVEDTIVKDATVEDTIVKDATLEDTIVKDASVKNANVQDGNVEDKVQSAQQSNTETVNLQTENDPLLAIPTVNDVQIKPSVNDDIDLDFDLDYGDQYDAPPTNDDNQSQVSRTFSAIDDNRSQISRASSIRQSAIQKPARSFYELGTRKEIYALKTVDREQLRREILGSIPNVPSTYKNKVLQDKLIELGQVAMACARNYTPDDSTYQEAVVALGERVQDIFEDQSAMLRQIDQYRYICAKLRSKQDQARMDMARIQAQRSRAQDKIAALEDMIDKVDRDAELFEGTHSFLSDLCKWSADQSKQ